MWGAAAWASGEGFSSIHSSLAFVGLWKSAWGGAGVTKAWSVQRSNEWSAEHTLKPRSWTCRKAACFAENQSSVKASSCHLCAGACTSATDTAAGTYEQNKSVLAWGYETVGAKSYARTSLPTGSCPVHQEACGVSWHSWISFTSWHLE